MEIALEQAELAARRGEVPVGAVIVSKQKVIARAGNRTLELKDATAHAEILVLRQAGEVLGSERLVDCDLYVTLEPCTMCAGAISMARIRRLYFGAEDEKTGGVLHGVRFYNSPNCHHRPEVYSGINASQSELLLKDFFKNRRD